jgi:hypothetical protein
VYDAAVTGTIDEIPDDVYLTRYDQSMLFIVVEVTHVGVDVALDGTKAPEYNGFHVLTLEVEY